MRLASLTHLVCLCVLCFGSLSFAQAQETWDESDTAIANHYIQSLQREPVYGKVLDLLWEHYEKHDQTRLLLEYFDEASKPEDALTAKLICGHLMRKKGNSEKAIELYQEVHEKLPENLFVINALAEVLNQEKRFEEAETYLEKLAEILDPQSDEWVQHQMSRAEIARKLENPEGAVAIWDQILKKRPNDLALRQRIVALLLEEGRTREAIASYEVLAGQDNVELRMQALRELARLYEFIDDFENASKTYETALGLVHFKHYLSDELIGRMVNLHERFGEIGALEESWLKLAEAKKAKEEHLSRMVEFYDLTANLEKQEVWLKKLVELVPASSDYRQQLAELLVENDHFEEAAEQLEILARSSSSVPLSILQMQAKVALTLDGVPAAEELIAQFLDKNSLSSEGLNQLLGFSQEHFLDSIVERLLRDQLENGWGGEGENPELRLATFHHERGRINRVKELLRAYVDSSPTEATKAKRLLEVAHSYREMDLLDEARAACQESIDMGRDSRGVYQVLAETYVESFEVAQAVELFQKAWERSETIRERIEIDQRIFNVLRAKTGERNGSWNTPQIPRVRPDVLLPGGNANGVDAEEAARTADLFRFYENIQRTAATEPTREHRFRAAWWAVELQDFDEAYRHLPDLHDPQNPVLEYEELLLKIAEQEERQGLILRQLELISKIEPDREEEFLIRKAQFRLSLGFEDEAIRTLQALVESPTSSLRSVQALAKAYEGQERFGALRDLWSKVYAKANILEKRQIIKPYAKTLILLDLKEDAVALYADLVETETDIIQRRKLFEDHMTLAAQHHLLDDWMPERYEELARLYPLDRFFPEALSQIYLATGRTEEAFSAMKRAYYMSDGDSELLERLGDLASQTRDLKSAIYYQRKLLSSEQNISPDSWIALIERLEKDMRIREADLTRSRLESKFAQDPDFLRQLARHYLDAGEISAARRLLGKIAALRPWDSASLLEIGLLSLEEGDVAEAESIFEQVLEQTAESAPLPGSPLVKLPIKSSDNERTPKGHSAKLGLEGYAESIEDFPLFPAERADKLADWMREAKPEFQRIPSEVSDQRLRALEELGRLKANSAEWAKRWDNSRTVSAQERLWALYYSGFYAEAQSILDSQLQPRTGRSDDDRWKLLYALMSLRTLQAHSIHSWIEEDAERNQFVTMGVFVLLRNGDYQFPEHSLEEVFSQVALSQQQAGELLKSLNGDQRMLESFQLGEAIALTREIDSYLFLASIASHAEELGREDRWRFWSERALENLQVDRLLPYYYQTYIKIIQDNFHFQASPAGQQEILETVYAKIAETPSWLDGEKLEAKVWTALAFGRTEEAVTHFKELIGSLEDSIKTNLLYDTPDRDERLAAIRWERFWRLLITMADQIDDRELLADLANAVPVERYAVPTGESVRAEYDELQLIQLRYRMEAASPPERNRLIDEYRAQISTTDQYMDLARGLESWNFVSEAVMVYRQLVDMERNDYSHVRSYFNACRQAQAYTQALDLIDEYLSQQRFFPESMTSFELHKDRSNFLMLSGNEEELAFYASAQDLTEHRLLYQKELIRLQLRAGDRESAILTLESLEADELNRADVLQLADLYLEEGAPERARELLEDLTFTGNQVPDLQLLERLTEVYSSDPLLDGEKLTDLARKALEYRGSAELTRKLAILLAKANRPGIADGILSLKSRSLLDAQARFELLLEQTHLRLTVEDVPTAEVESLVTLFHAWPESESSGLSLLELVALTAEEHADLWLQAIERTRSSPSAQLLSRLAQLYLSPVADTATQIHREILPMIDGLPPYQMRLAVNTFQAIGRPEEAWDLLTRLHDQGHRHPREDTDLAVEILHDLGREDLVLRWHRWNLDYSGTPSQTVQIAQIYRDAGYLDLAMRLFREKYESLTMFNINQQQFLTEYARFLLEQEDYPQAERVLKNLFQKNLNGDPKLLVDLYGKWGRLDRLESELRKFFLNPVQLAAAEDARIQYPDHWPEEDGLGKNVGFRSRF